jgi:hypothetical protein
MCRQGKMEETKMALQWKDEGNDSYSAQDAATGLSAYISSLSGDFTWLITDLSRWSEGEVEILMDDYGLYRGVAVTAQKAMKAVESAMRIAREEWYENQMGGYAGG